MGGLNYYALLEIPREADKGAIVSAYRRLALKYHPERDAENENHFRLIAEAYTVLSDPVKKAKYEQYGEAGLKDGVLEQSEYRGFQYVGDPLELFNSFFGTHSPHAVLVEENFTKFNLSKRINKVETVKEAEIPVPCSLKDLWMGGVTKVQKVERQRYDREQRSYVDSKNLSIAIEKGWLPGTRLRFNGEGNQFTPAEPECEDIVFVIAEEPHPTFERIKGTHDLLHVHECTLLEALTGHVIELTCLNDNDIKLWISEQVSPAYEKRVLGHGMQKPDGSFGDLVIRWYINFPQLSADKKEALKALLAN